MTHVVAALWSSEVLHVLRLRTATFAALCPDPVDGFGARWDGLAAVASVSTTFILFDPLPGQCSTRRRWVGLDAVGNVEPRYRGYADAVRRLRGARLA